jgi:integral membrane protein
MEKVFRVIAFLEGVSYLLLLFIATPVKYIGNDPQYVKMLGMPHGVLFIMYIILAFMIKAEYKWNSRQFSVILIASLIPFGTFYVDKKYLSNK